MGVSDVAHSLGLLRDAITNSKNASVTCNWQKQPYRAADLVVDLQGKIQRTGYGESKMESDALAVSYMPVLGACNYWELRHGAVLGSSSSQNQSTAADWYAICDETIVNPPNKPLTFKDINETKDRIRSGSVMPVWDYSYHPDYQCGRHYCDPGNDVLISLCGNSSYIPYPTTYTLKLLETGIDALKESPKRAANCTWRHRWPGKERDYRIDYLVDWKLDLNVSTDALDPYLKVGKVDLGESCWSFLGKIKQKPAPIVPVPVETTYPDPVPNSDTGMIKTNGTEYVGYVIGAGKNEGGFNRPDLESMRSSLRGNETLPKLLVNKDLSTEQITEQDCHTFWCYDDKNILFSLCGKWYPLTATSRHNDSRYRNTTLARLTMRSMLSAFICADDEEPGDNSASDQHKSGLMNSIHPRADTDRTACSNVKAENVDRKSRQFPYRGLVRQFKDGEKYSIQLGRIESVTKRGHKSCKEWQKKTDVVPAGR
ncbi:hypothetical protein TWF696_004938 [Orbilia brochopaga]|uniref:Uncharacterized protein n=1 Tax=Orbilia brochopaga TaxID=3140254 RepID=A0AAV9V0U2_9PEZI